MATITKTENGFRAQIYVRGRRDSKSFRTKREAMAWASELELKLQNGENEQPDAKYSFAELLEKYSEEESPKKRGSRWEQIRLNAMIHDPILGATGKLSEITPETLGQWRNTRLGQVAPGSVLRELTLLSAVFEYARRELKWIKANPLSDVRRPAAPDHRRILITRGQIRRMLETMGYSRRKCDSVTQACAMAFLLALRTGMRAGEICGLTWDRVFDDYCKTSGKNTAATRDIPLTPKARAIIELMRGFDNHLVFGLKSQTLDAMFRKYRERAGLSGFTFHDSRHTAATWLARKLHLLDLCLMFGWSNTKHALIYYNAPASDIAKQLSPKLKQPSAPERGQSQ